MCVFHNLPHACCFFFFNDTATTEIYTLSLHDALPILPARRRYAGAPRPRALREERARARRALGARSEEHTSELQSRFDLVCRLLLEKKKKYQFITLHDLQYTCKNVQSACQ